MKKLILSLGLVFLATSAFTQWTNSGTLTINGNMPVITQVQITDLAVNLNLGIDNVNVLLGEVAERSNSSTGYVVTVSSANSGNLVGTVLGETTAYTLSIGGSVMNLSGAGATVTDTTARTTATGVSKNIEITTTSGSGGGALLAQDTYSDTLTFTIAPK